MKRVLLMIALLCGSCVAQAATRPVVLTWTASTSTSVTQYLIFTCTVPAGGTSCTPSVTGTPAGTTAATTYTFQGTTGTAYGVSVVASAPACTSTTPLGTACGNSLPVTVSYIPVPPNPNGATNVVVVVP